MSYNINVATVGTLVIADGTKNNSTSLTLVGKNYPGYGTYIIQDLVNLLQNWTGINQPSSPVTGQLWYNLQNNTLQIYTGTVFKNITSVASSTSFPTLSNQQGDLFYKSDDQQLYIYSGTTWILIGPSYTSSQQKTTAVADVITDTSNGSHTVLKLWVGNHLTGVVSKDSFTPSSTFTALNPGFATISPGYNVDANLFGGVGTTISGTLITNAQPYITSVGTLSSLNVSTTILGSIQNAQNVVNAAQGNITSLGTLTGLSMGGAITTTGNGTYNIGTSANKFGTVYATASQAQYADLAENYRTDGNPGPNDIMVIGGNEEVTSSTISHDHRFIGVMSPNPAYLMNVNDGNSGSAIALTGRVYVNVRGPIARGDCVVSSDLRGVGEKLDMYKYTPGCIVGKSLNSIDDYSVKLIEVVIGVR